MLSLTEPDGARVDSGLDTGTEVGGSYDPMLAKVVVHGADRAEALHRLDRALAGYTLLGVPTNVAFLRALLRHPAVVSGELDTGMVERSLDDLLAGTAVPPEVLAAAALERMLALESGDDPWDVPDGWRPGAHAWAPWIITPSGGAPVEVRVQGRAASARVAVGGDPPVDASLTRPFTLTYGGRTTSFEAAHDGRTLWLGRDGHAWALSEHVRAEGGTAAGAAGDGCCAARCRGRSWPSRRPRATTSTPGSRWWSSRR